MSKKVYSIYIRRNLITNMAYIGQSVNPKRRWIDQERNQGHFGRSLRHHGRENFASDVLFEVDTQESANFWERYLIADCGTLAPNGYNIASGGHSNPRAGKSKQELQEWRNNQIKNSGMRGKNHTEESKQKMAEANTGKSPSAETLRRQSEAQKGKKRSLEHRDNMSESIKKQWIKRKQKKSSPLQLKLF